MTLGHAPRSIANVSTSGDHSGSGPAGLLTRLRDFFQTVAGIVTALTTIIGGGVAVYHFALQDDGSGLDQQAASDSPTTTQAQLEPAAPLLVKNPPVAEEPAGEGVRQTRASMPTVEVTLQNTGARRAVLNGARFTVRGFGVLEECYLRFGAPLEVSATYDVVLPLRPRIGQSVVVPVSQQLAADEADRIAFRVGNPELGPATKIGYVYLLEVSLLHGPNRAQIRLGRAVVSLPGTPSSAVVGPGEGADAACVADNRALLSRLTGGDVAVSSQLAALHNELR